MIDIYVSIRILEKSCRYLRRWLHLETSYEPIWFVSFLFCPRGQAWKAVPQYKDNYSYKVLFLGRRTFFMLEFEVIEIIKPNVEVIKIIKKYSYTNELTRGKPRGILNALNQTTLIDLYVF